MDRTTVKPPVSDRHKTEDLVVALGIEQQQVLMH